MNELVNETVQTEPEADQLRRKQEQKAAKQPEVARPA